MLVKIPKEQLLPEIIKEVESGITEKFKMMNLTITIEKVEWTAEGLDVFLSDTTSHSRET